MHLDHILGNVTTGHAGVLRSYLDEPVDQPSDWEQEELVNYVNLEHRHLFSVVRGFNEDWFGRVYVFPITSGVQEYYLPMDCVNPRRLEIIKATSVSGSAPNLVVNESTAGPLEVDEITLNEKMSVRHSMVNTSFEAGFGYYLFDDKIVFEPSSSLNSSVYGRLFYSPQAPDLHRGIAQSGGVNTITLANVAATETVGEPRKIDNYYQGMRIEIILGPGVGQLKRIVSYDGTTQVATVESNWSTQPDATSHYSIVSPIQEDYHELMVLGAALRAKGIKVEDDTTGIGAVYMALRSDMDNALEKRNQQSNRRVVATSGRAGWF